MCGFLVDMSDNPHVRHGSSLGYRFIDAPWSTVPNSLAFADSINIQMFMGVPGNP